jgi:hypothetical protein
VWLYQVYKVYCRELVLSHHDTILSIQMDFITEKAILEHLRQQVVLADVPEEALATTRTLTPTEQEIRKFLPRKSAIAYVLVRDKASPQSPSYQIGKTGLAASWTSKTAAAKAAKPKAAAKAAKPKAAKTLGTSKTIRKS